METSDLPRHQLIVSLTEQHSEKTTDVAINLWEQMATQIISLVGEGGFHSLYARSLFLAQSTFPWIDASALSPRADHRFAALKMCLEGQTSAQASAANTLLLITFTDIVASLIGEQLTTRILRLAWGGDVSHEAGKEFNHALVKAGHVGVIDTRSLDLSIDETLHGLIACRPSASSSTPCPDSSWRWRPSFRKIFAARCTG